jgi:L-ascorbate metabolism protein UlaG (beta-lactamase superfamily)
MKVTKFGHCCLLIEEGDLRILTDPGVYNEIPQVTNVDVILITHEHPDHCHIDSLKIIRESNPGAEVITHKEMKQVLDDANIEFTTIKFGEDIERYGIKIGSRGTKHALVHPDLPICSNTGFLIAKRLFYPGDAFHNPSDIIEILALPVSGPWMKLEEAIEYAKEVKPKVAFPVHDGMLRDEALESSRMAPRRVLEPLGVELRDMRVGSAEEF